MHNTKIPIIYHMKIKGQITVLKYLHIYVFYKFNVFSIESLFIKTIKYIFVSVFLHFK